MLAILFLAWQNIPFSSLFAAGDVSRNVPSGIFSGHPYLPRSSLKMNSTLAKKFTTRQLAFLWYFVAFRIESIQKPVQRRSSSQQACE